MKHTYKLLLALPILTLAISSCDGKLDELVEDGNYTISKDANYATFENLTDSFDVESSSATKTLSIKSVGSNWQLSSDESWIHFSPSSGTGDQEVTCSFDKNPYSYQKRRGTITLSTSSSKITTNAIQEQSLPQVTFNPSHIELPAPGGHAEVVVTTNTTNLRVDPNNTADEITAYYSNGKLYIDAAPNTSLSYATYNVGLEYDYLPTYDDELRTGYTNINVELSRPRLTASESYKEFQYEGGTFTVNITSDLPWTVKNDDNWLSIYPRSGEAGTTEVTVIVSPQNENYSRTGYIYYQIGGNSIASTEVYQFRKYAY